MNTGFFIFSGMGNCRLQNLKPPCGYNVEGIQRIRLLDVDDFTGFEFDNDDLYNNCKVVDILRSGDFIDLDTPDSAKYSSSLQNGVYTHTLETFIGDLSAFYAANLHLATKRRYIVTFHTRAGRYHVFAYEAGAALTYANQTAEAVGSLVTITGPSIYPLFEADAAAFDQEIVIEGLYANQYENEYE